MSEYGVGLDEIHCIVFVPGCLPKRILLEVFGLLFGYDFEFVGNAFGCKCDF